MYTFNDYQDLGAFSPMFREGNICFDDTVTCK
jgi:hypothetical protein